MPKALLQGHEKSGHLNDQLRQNAPHRNFTFTFTFCGLCIFSLLFRFAYKAGKWAYGKSSYKLISQKYRGKKKKKKKIGGIVSMFGLRGFFGTDPKYPLKLARKLLALQDALPSQLSV